MTNLIKNINRQLIKIGGNLVIISQEQNPAIENAGLYDENDNLIKSWDELVSEGLVAVE